jgi:hypothetical protein
MKIRFETIVYKIFPKMPIRYMGPSFGSSLGIADSERDKV